MQSSVLVLAPLALPMAGVLVQALLGRVLSSKGKGVLAFLTVAAAFLAVVAAYPEVVRSGVIEASFGAWDDTIRFALHVDGLSQLFALMATGIGAAVLFYSIEYLAHEPAATRFYMVIQTFIAGFILLVYAQDLLLAYVGWELIGICSFLLVSFWYAQSSAARGARKVFVMTHLAGYALLGAILLVQQRAGTTLWTDPRVGASFTIGMFLLVVIAAAAKSVQFPLHTWIASAMSAPTPVSALLHSACYVTAGVYLLARMHSIVSWPVAWQQTVIWLGVVTMVVGALFAMVQSDAKRMLAFSTVSQIGYMVFGLGMGTPLGIAAGLLHCFNHGLFKASLFLGAGSIQHATGTRDMDRLGGLARRMPTTALLWIVSSAAIAGVPLLNGFVSKWLIYVAAMESGQTIPGLVAWITSVVTMFVFMRATSAMFFGLDGEQSREAHESPGAMLVGSGVLVVACAVLGVAPQLALRRLIEPALTATGDAYALGVSWFGLSAGAGAWYVAPALLLAVMSALIGGVLYWVAIRRSRTSALPVPGAVGPPRLAAVGSEAASGLVVLQATGIDEAAVQPFTGGAPLPAGGRLDATAFSATFSDVLAPLYRAADVDRYYSAAIGWLQTAANLLGRISERAERRAVLWTLAGAGTVGFAAALIPSVTRAERHPQATISILPVVCAALIALACLWLEAIRREGVCVHTVSIGVAGALAVASLVAEAEVLRLALLEAGSLLAVVSLLRRDSDRRAGWVYMGAVLLSAVLLAAGTLGIEVLPPKLVLACLITGFTVKLALLPAYVWLPTVAKRVPAPLVGVVIAVVDVSAFAELVVVRQHAPWLFATAWPWLVLAVLSAVGGAVLALAQRDAKKLLAFSTITDSGFIVIGILVGGSVGLRGAVIGIAAHALAKALLFTTVSHAEADGPMSLDRRGVARRYPAAAAGFVLGTLAALGVPPTIGFAGHWRLYATALAINPMVFACLVLATGMSLLAYTRFIVSVWWGSEVDGAYSSERDGEAPLITAATVVPLAVLGISIVVAGLWPALY